MGRNRCPGRIEGAVVRVRGLVGVRVVRGSGSIGFLGWVGAEVVVDGADKAKVKVFSILGASEDNRAPGVKPGLESVGGLLHNLVEGEGIVEDVVVFG